jgi:hypothetical protein
MKRILVWLIVVVAAGFTVGVPRAQDAAKDWPARTVRIIIPLGAGGGAATGCAALPLSRHNPRHSASRDNIAQIGIRYSQGTRSMRWRR